VCYVETKNLDGETNLKIKRGVEGIKNLGAGGAKTLQVSLLPSKSFIKRYTNQTKRFREAVRSVSVLL